MPDTDAVTLRYKTDRQQDEFRKLDPRLRIIALALIGYCIWRWKIVPMITCIYRTHVEQNQIYLVAEPEIAERYRENPWVSVHQVWRGIDFRIHDFNELQIQELDHWLDEHFAYDRGRRETSIVHAVGEGGRHLHIQCDAHDYLIVRKAIFDER